MSTVDGGDPSDRRPARYSTTGTAQSSWTEPADLAAKKIVHEAQPEIVHWLFTPRAAATQRDAMGCPTADEPSDEAWLLATEASLVVLEDYR